MIYSPRAAPSVNKSRIPSLPKNNPYLVCIVLDHRGVNFLTIIGANREAVTLPKELTIVIPVLTIVSSIFLNREL